MASTVNLATWVAGTPFSVASQTCPPRHLSSVGTHRQDEQHRAHPLPPHRVSHRAGAGVQGGAVFTDKG